MIQATREADVRAYIETEAQRIDTGVAKTNIRFLAKFINDLDGAVFYGYPTTYTINDRYTVMSWTYHTSPDVYTGRNKI